MSITPFFHVYHKYVFNMANINKIKLSGTTYSIQDENACKVVELTQAEYDALPATAKTSNSLFVITDAAAGDLSNYYTKSETSGATEISTALASKADTATTYTKTQVDTALGGKQATLVSGTNIKTINNESILGSGNIEIQGGGGVTTVDDTLSSTSTNPVQNKVVKSATDRICRIWGYGTSGQTNIDILYWATGATSNYIDGYVQFSKINGKKIIGDKSFPTDNFSLVETSAITTSISSSSTDSQVPSAKAVYDALQEGGGGMTEDDELLLSTALTDLNDRKADKSLLGSYQRKGDYVTTNTLNTRLAEYETALDEQNVEEVTAYALNDLNTRFGGLKLTKVTESEYAALTTKDENTLYIVVADPQTR
jgi:hypothetical protein